MSEIDGAWNCTVDTPMGAQSFTLTLRSAGSTFTGRADGGIGGMDVDGDVDGEALAWTMRVPKPMPLTLNCKATVAGDTITGKMSAGIFGSFKLEGTRA